jgi:ADP-ribose pyrophosphatase YjhB (NUDIX family)
MCQEFVGQGYWVPGGGVDPGETLTAAAVRETQEEAGVKVELKGILHVDYNKNRSWRRVIFYAEPVESTPPAARASAVEGGSGGEAGVKCAATSSAEPNPAPGGAERVLGSKMSMKNGPKTLPDFESAGACWVSVDELQRLPLRSASEPCTWFPYVAAGKKVMQLKLDEKVKELFQGYEL